MNEVNEYSLNELSEKSGIPGRTIRYYISRGLVQRPIGGGKGASYTEDHLKRLNIIKMLQEAGLSLAEINHKLTDADTKVDIGEPTSWSIYQIQSDVNVMVKNNLSPWRIKKIKNAIENLKALLEEENEEN